MGVERRVSLHIHRAGASGGTTLRTLRIRTRKIGLFLIGGLTLLATAPSVLLAQGPPPAVVASSPSASPAIISPANADGRFDASTIQAHFSVQPEQPPAPPPKAKRPPQTITNELRVSYAIKDASGTLLRTLNRTEIVPPPPAGAGAGAPVQMDISVSFDGRDETAALIADGMLTVTITSDLFAITAQQTRLVGSGNPVETSLQVDNTPPGVSTSPVDGQILNRSSFEILASYSDASSGVDVATFHLSIDGTEVAANSFVGPTGARHAIVPSAALSQGDHALEVKIEDQVGNRATHAVSFTVDTVFPSLVMTPTNGERVGTATPAITIAYSDGGTGIDLGTMHLTLDGVEVTGQVARSAESATYRVTAAAPLSEGTHAVTFALSDHAGNVARAASFFVVALPMSIVVTPGGLPAERTIVAGQSTALTVSVLDSGGTGIPGIPVWFQILTGEGALSLVAGNEVIGKSPSPPLGTVTGAAGMATVTLRSDVATQPLEPIRVTAFIPTGWASPRPRSR